MSPGGFSRAHRLLPAASSVLWGARYSYRGTQHLRPEIASVGQTSAIMTVVSSAAAARQRLL
jgi:hypothetical protein